MSLVLLKAVWRSEASTFAGMISRAHHNLTILSVRKYNSESKIYDHDTNMIVALFGIRYLLKDLSGCYDVALVNLLWSVFSTVVSELLYYNVIFVFQFNCSCTKYCLSTLTLLAAVACDESG